MVGRVELRWRVALPAGAMTITGHRTERQPARSEPDGGARPRVGCEPYRAYRVNDPPGRRNVNSRLHNVTYS